MPGHYDDTVGSCIALHVSQLKSIFTDEALSLYNALTTYVSAGGYYFLLTDNLAVLRVLQDVSIVP